MTSDRLRRVEQIYHAALDRAPADRAAFLKDACGGDAALRSEVEALIARERSADEMFAVPAFDAAARALARDEGASLAGSRLGSYEIGSLLGAGGMGRVYRARDARLGRDVAIKVLPSLFLSDPERVARFEREARVLASLNHPHIATLFGVEDVDGVRALVLELVEGPTLADVIARHGAGLPVAECLRIARQLADALDAAHQAGIVHRDLKPANIKLTPGGAVKVLDFGLARPRDVPAAPGVPDAMTREGALMGTTAYMSPEQARGRPVDQRTDIWAFGCVLYEMLTGRAAFRRDTDSDTIAAVLGQDPDWSTLPQTTPPGLVRLLRWCLEKVTTARLRDIADARLDAEAMHDASERRAGAQAVSSRERVLIAAVLIAGLALAGMAWRFLTDDGRAAGPGDVVEFRVGPPPGYPPWSGVAVSPNGRYVTVGTFGSGPMIWLLTLGSSERRPVPGTEAAAAPFWSPDSASLGYFARGKLWRTDLAGGPPISLCEAVGWLGASWGSGDRIIFSSDNQLFMVAASGGAPSKIALPDSEGGPVLRSHPRFLPDGRRFIYHERGPGRSGVFAGSIDGGLRKHLVGSAEAAVYAAPGYLLFVRGTALLAQPLDLESLTLRGRPSVVAPDVAPGFLNARAAFSVSDTGVLAFVHPREGTPGELTWFNQDGRAIGSIAQPREVEYLNPAISPEGNRVAVNRMDPQTGNWDIWILDTASDVPTRVTFDEATDSDPIWSPDGTEIAFASDRGGRAGIYRKAADGSGAEQLLFRVERPGVVVVPTDWARDGTIVFSQSRFPPGGWRVWTLRLSPERRATLLPQPGNFQSYAGRVSPDSQWLAYASTETSIFEVFVRRLSGAGPMKQVSRGGGTHPRWSADGRRLVYWARPGGIMSVDVASAGASPHLSEPKSVIPTRVLELIDGRPHYDVTRDGRRYLLRQPAGVAEPPIGVIVNWPQRVAR